jgi:hypothetical protein
MKSDNRLIFLVNRRIDDPGMAIGAKRTRIGSANPLIRLGNPARLSGGACGFSPYLCPDSAIFGLARVYVHGIRASTGSTWEASVTVGIHRTPAVRSLLLGGVSALFLAGCVTTDMAHRPVADPHPDLIGQVAEFPRQVRMIALREREHEQRWQCVPFARELSGIEIYGNAWTWWRSAAEEGYRRGNTPVPGAVMVFSRTGRLGYGHVSVVAEVLNDREILVDHANWGNSRSTRGGMDWGVRVVDVSDANDWSAVRVWWNPTDTLGRSVYAIDGFIYNDRLTIAQR